MQWDCQIDVLGAKAWCWQTRRTMRDFNTSTPSISQ
jgi:hypothetical protein